MASPRPLCQWLGMRPRRPGIIGIGRPHARGNPGLLARVVLTLPRHRALFAEQGVVVIYRHPYEFDPEAM